MATYAGDDMRENSMVLLRGEVYEDVREAEQTARDTYEFDEKKDGVSYFDPAWSVSFHWLESGKEDVMFSWAGFTEDAGILEDEHRSRLRSVGLVIEGVDGSEEIAVEYDHLAQIPEYILDRVVDAGYTIYANTEPDACPQCGHDRFIARFEQPSDPVDHVVLSRWKCMDCDAMIAAEIPDAPVRPRGDDDLEEVYGETGGEYRYSGYCPSCEAERMFFETVSNEQDVCLTCGERVPKEGPEET